MMPTLATPEPILSRDAVIMICGIPGAGKTVLAEGLHEVFGYPMISTGDIARAVDPHGVAAGDLANEQVFRDAFFREVNLRMQHDVPLILDGFPRSEQQIEYVAPDRRLIILLNCRIDIAIDRQIRRGRPGDTRELATKRTYEQYQLLDLDNPNGWLTSQTTWGRVVNTSTRSVGDILVGFIRYLNGDKRQAF